MLPNQDLSTLGLQNARELIAITSWYLWWEIRKLVHEGKTQDAYHLSMGIGAITANYVIASSPKATLERRGWIGLL